MTTATKPAPKPPSGPSTVVRHYEGQRWEYKTAWLRVRVGPAADEDLEAVLGRLGADGWEMAASFPTQSGIRCFFKRPAARTQAAGNMAV